MRTLRVLSLCDRTGVMVRPWHDAGHECTTVDMQPSSQPWIHDPDDVRHYRPDGHYDIVFTHGDSYSVIFDFPFATDEFTAKAQIRLYPESAVKAAEFTIEYVDTEEGQIKLSLTPEQTEKLPLRAYWDLQLTKDDGEFVETYMRGSVFVQRQITKDVPESGNWSPTGWEQG